MQVIDNAQSLIHVTLSYTTYYAFIRFGIISKNFDIDIINNNWKRWGKSIVKIKIRNNSLFNNLRFILRSLYFDIFRP